MNLNICDPFSGCCFFVFMWILRYMQTEMINLGLLLW